jgi:hypothetical protein
MGVVRHGFARAMAVALVLVLVACTGDGEPQDTPDATASGDPDRAGGDPAGPVDADLAALRLELERSYGHHVMLAAEVLRTTADDSARRRDADALLDANTSELAVALAQTLGADPVDVTALWSEHVDALRDAAAGRDDAVTDAGSAAYGDLVSEAVDGAITAEEAAGQLTDHAEQMVALLTSYRDGDVLASYATQREAFNQLVGAATGVALAAAAQDRARVSSGPVELRSALGQLLGEHTALTIATARRSARGRDDARAPAAALNGNTEDLTAALLSIYDEDTAVAFDEHWRGTIGALLRLTVAVAEADDDGTRTARRRLNRGVRRLARQVAEMTDGEIDQGTARDVLGAHFTGLARHGTAIANGRFRRGSRRGFAAYTDSAAVADLLADGIVAQRPDDFPEQ